ncbi:MAG: hypothetical protein M0Z67_06825 [Nitrospiraceae bacterium]|nr:hypothetical protein [Nitrospiraceae bacterium]
MIADYGRLKKKVIVRGQGKQVGTVGVSENIIEASDLSPAAGSEKFVQPILISIFPLARPVSL